MNKIQKEKLRAEKQVVQRSKDEYLNLLERCGIDHPDTRTALNIYTIERADFKKMKRRYTV